MKESRHTLKKSIVGDYTVRLVQKGGTFIVARFLNGKFVEIKTFEARRAADIFFDSEVAFCNACN